MGESPGELLPVPGRREAENRARGSTTDTPAGWQCTTGDANRTSVADRAAATTRYSGHPAPRLSTGGGAAQLICATRG
jgi:hypothetical protein